jgi:2,3-bisphosphoglycerate-independent phosphoglycerate mutase
VHLIGLVSDGGVHSSLAHLQALIALAGTVGAGAADGPPDLVVHAFTDGRDTLPHSGAAFLAALDHTPGVRVGTVVGRYWAMDRDRRWDRTQRAYDLLVHGGAKHHADSGEDAVRAAYARGETDEFIEPTLVGREACIRPQDSVIAFNFRPDRMRQLTRALAEPGFAAAPSGARGAEELPGWRGRDGAPPVSRYTTMTRYEEDWGYPVAFAPERPAATLGTVLEDAGATQLHVAETEKYPHVTYFFNGGAEAPLRGERRELVPSPRDVPTYDHKPQMSAAAAATAFVEAWRAEQPRFGIINFANADMVGHTGVIEAAVVAVEAVDECLASVVAAVHELAGVCVVTADHGNAEQMLEPDGSPNTAHSLNPVPLVVTSPAAALRQQPGILADVAPTVLALLGIPQPAAMTGHSLLAAR